MDKKIAFIGQGFVGKSYADDFESRGLSVVRYALEPPYSQNKDKVKEADIVFVCVPTPSTPKGFDDSIVSSVLPLAKEGATIVIKSTLLPKTTERLQKENPKLHVFHSPEFLTELTAKHDAANPNRNIIGIPSDNVESQKRAKEVLGLLPKAPYEKICSSREAELTKYGGNIWFYLKVVFINMLFDLSQDLKLDWETVRDNMAADPRIGRTHLDPIHKSGRGAGGPCFIKDFTAFKDLYTKTFPKDQNGLALLNSMEKKNLELLKESDKDQDLVSGIYGS